MAGKAHNVETKAKVHRLLVDGHTPRAVEAHTGISHNTIARWRANWPTLAQEQDELLHEHSRLIALQADEATAQGIQHLLDEGPAASAKALIALNAIAGTHRDKLNRQSGPQTNIAVIIQQAANAMRQAAPGEYEAEAPGGEIVEGQ